MVLRTVTHSVPEVSAPVNNKDALERELQRLQKRFPGVIWGRYLDKIPSVPEDVFIAPGASVIGDVRLSPGCSLWFGCVLRGDLAPIEIGANSNVQDGTVIHVGDRDPVFIANDVVIGHRAVIHGCHIEERVLIGMQSTVMDAARIGRGSVVAAGAVVMAESQVPASSLVVGVPARVKKTLDPMAAEFHAQLAQKYRRLAHNYRVG